MKMIVAATLGAVAIVSLSAGGCASSRIEITVDVYKKPPGGRDDLSPARLDDLNQAIETADRVFGSLPRQMDEFTKALLIAHERQGEFLRAVQKQAEPSKSDTDLADALAKGRQTYIIWLNNNADAGRKLADVTRRAVASYKQLQEQRARNPLAADGDGVVQARKHLRTAVSELMRQLELVSDGKAADTSAEQSFVRQLTTAIDQRGTLQNAEFLRGRSGLSQTEKQQAERTGKKFVEAVGRVKELREALDRASGDATNGLANAAPRDAPLIGDDLAIEQGIVAVNRLAGTSVVAGLKGDRAVADIGLSVAGSGSTLARRATDLDLFTSQIDRIQDPTDAAWPTIVSAPESSWAKDPFAHSVNYAEGKSEVVVVRDRLGQFRVQRARNDPSALIAAQLDISGAIASAAAQTLAAATGGAPLAAMLQPGNKGDPPAEGDAKTYAALSSEAGLTAKARARAQARELIQANIQRIRDDLRAIPSTSKVAADLERVAELVRQLKVQVETIKPLLSPAEERK